MKMKTAKDAYEATKARNDMINSQTLRNISTKIDEAISQGNFSVDIYESVSNEVIGILMEKGYNVKGFHDPRDGDILTISWKID